MNGTYGTTTALQVSSSRLVDDLLRRELRVGDPRNPQEVVTALRKRYAADAARLDQEGAGLPIRYQPEPPALPAAGSATTAGSAEEARTRLNLESDLSAIIDARENREWAPEIRGWRDTLLRELAEGTAAARFAQDPAMRDRAFLAVRKLGEFARVARLIGVTNLSLCAEYRRLAQTLDDGASVIRILMGEALYGAGLADGGLIIQVPVTDVRIRRDTLVTAVRRLSGAAEVAEEGGDWGDGIAAYGTILEELEQHSAQDLTVYLREEYLASVLDGLISSISRRDPDTLRQVAATAPIEVSRLARLLDIALPLVRPIDDPLSLEYRERPQSGSLSYFVQSLQLFVSAFRTTRAGARLIDLAVPLAMAAGQTDEADRHSRRLLRDLVGLRSELANETDCMLACCGCDTDSLALQVVLDKILFDLDRAIDLYALGTGYPDAWGDDPTRPGLFSEERRASAYSFFIDQVLDEQNPIAKMLGNITSTDGKARVALGNRGPLRELLKAAATVLAKAQPTGNRLEMLLEETLVEQIRTEHEFSSLVGSLAPRCPDARRSDIAGAALRILEGIRKIDPSRERVSVPVQPIRSSAATIASSMARGNDRMARIARARAGTDVLQTLLGVVRGLRDTPSGRTAGTAAGTVPGGKTRRGPRIDRPAPDAGERRDVTGPPAGQSDPDLVAVLDTLQQAESHAGTLRNMARSEDVKKHWASYVRRSIDSGIGVPNDLVFLMSHLDAAEDKDIDMGRVTNVLSKYRSRA